MMYEEDDRAPLSKGLYEPPSEQYVPSFVIMKRLYDEEKDAMYCHEEEDDEDSDSGSMWDSESESARAREWEAEDPKPDSDSESVSDSDSASESDFNDTFLYKNVYYV